MTAQRIGRYLTSLLLSVLVFLNTGCTSDAQPAGDSRKATPAAKASNTAKPETSSPEASVSPSKDSTSYQLDLDLRGGVPNPCKLLQPDQFESAFDSSLESTKPGLNGTSNGYRDCQFRPSNHDSTAYLTVIAVREGPMGAHSSETGATMNWSDSFRNVEGYAGDTSANDRLCMESNNVDDTMDGDGCLTVVLDPDTDLRTDPAAITDHVTHAWLRYNQRSSEEFTAIGFVTKKTAHQPSLVIAALLPPGEHSKDRLLDAAAQMVNTLRVQLYK